MLGDMPLELGEDAALCAGAKRGVLAEGDWSTTGERAQTGGAGAALCRAGSTAGRSLAKGWFGPGVGLQKQETTADLGVGTTGTEVGCSAASSLSPHS